MVKFDFDADPDTIWSARFSQSVRTDDIEAIVVENQDTDLEPERNEIKKCDLETLALGPLAEAAHLILDNADLASQHETATKALEDLDAERKRIGEKKAFMESRMDMFKLTDNAKFARGMNSKILKMFRLHCYVNSSYYQHEHCWLPMAAFKVRPAAARAQCTACGGDAAIQGRAFA